MGLLNNYSIYFRYNAGQRILDAHWSCCEWLDSVQLSSCCAHQVMDLDFMVIHGHIWSRVDCMVNERTFWRFKRRLMELLLRLNKQSFRHLCSLNSNNICDKCPLVIRNPRIKCCIVGNWLNIRVNDLSKRELQLYFVDGLGRTSNS